MPGELLCGWELFALEWSWTQDSFAGDLEGEVKHQPSCSEGGCRVMHNIADLLLILAVWDSGWVCSISGSQWVSSSFRFMSPELFVWALWLRVSAASVAYLCCQVWRLWEASMAPRPYLSPYFMSSLLLSVLTYNNFRATTRSRSLTENSSSAPTIMSGLIPVIDSLFRITYSSLLPASNLSCYILSDSQLSSTCHSLGRVGWGDKLVSVGFKSFVSGKLKTSSIRCSENKGRGCTGCKAEKLRSHFSVFV